MCLEKHSKSPYPKTANVPKWLVWLLAPTMGITRKFIAKNVNHPIQLDNSKSKKQLNIDYIPVEDTLISFFQQLVDAKEICINNQTLILITSLTLYSL